MMQFAQTERVAAQVEIAKERLQIRTDRSDQSVVNRNRHIVRKERSLQRRWIMPGARLKDIRLNRIGKRRGQRILMIPKFRVELMKGAFAQFVIALHQKRAERTLRKRCL